ncbi:MAG: LysR substrate-binding domain-containing protein [Alphaproteobacteria bacterium]
MNLRHIELFRAVMRHGGANRAAEALRIAQPGISRAIAALESELGFLLFSRVRRRLVPTAEGEAFHREVERRFAGIDELHVAVRNIRTVGTGQLRVACLQALSQGFMADVLARFALDYPEVTVSLQVRSSTRVWEWVADARCDIGIAAPNSGFHGVSSEHFLSVPVVAALPPGHRLAGKATIQPHDLAGESFLSLGHDDPTRLEIDRIFAVAGIQREMRYETQFAATLCRLVARGLGVALVNPIVAPDFAHMGVVARPFHPVVRMASALIVPSRRPPDRIANAFIAMLYDRRDQVRAAIDLAA